MDTRTMTTDWKRSGEGDCYRQAVRLAESLRESIPEGVPVEVVHGLVTGTAGEAEGIRYGHAWVEIAGSICADASRGGEPVTVPGALYYEIGSIDPDETHRYSLKEAHRAMVDHGHYGPWHFRQECAA